MNYSKLTALVILSLALASCDKSESGHVGYEPPKTEPKEVQDLGTVPLRFTSQLKLDYRQPDDQKKLESFKSKGCPSLTESSLAQNQILRAGDEIYESKHINSQISHTSIIQKKSLKEIRADSFTYVSKSLSFRIEEAGGEIFKVIPEPLYSCKIKKPDNTFEASCENPKTDVTTLLNDQGLNYLLRTLDLGFRYCFLVEKGPSTATFENEIGIYELPSGIPVHGLLKRTFVSGDVVCHDQIVGKGTRATTSIYSSEVTPLGEPSLCSGKMVLFTDTIKLNNMAIESMRIEVMSGTLRK